MHHQLPPIESNKLEFEIRNLINSDNSIYDNKKSLIYEMELMNKKNPISKVNN